MHVNYFSTKMEKIGKTIKKKRSASLKMAVTQMGEILTLDAWGPSLHTKVLSTREESMAGNFPWLSVPSLPFCCYPFSHGNERSLEIKRSFYNGRPPLWSFETPILCECEKNLQVGQRTMWRSSGWSRDPMSVPEYHLLSLRVPILHHQIHLYHVPSVYYYLTMLFQEETKISSP